MAALEKIRSKFGLAVSILIALALLSFIIDPGTLQTAINSMSTKYDVGKIDGKRISYTDFQENVEKFTSINEIISGSSSQNEQTQKNIRNAAWQDMMDKYLFIKNAKAAGIKVGEDEMLSLVSSSNPSAILVQNPIFMDESGNYSEEVLRQFLSRLRPIRPEGIVNIGIIFRIPSTPSSSIRSMVLFSMLPIIPMLFR